MMFLSCCSSSWQSCNSNSHEANYYCWGIYTHVIHTYISHHRFGRDYTRQARGISWSRTIPLFPPERDGLGASQAKIFINKKKSLSFSFFFLDKQLRHLFIYWLSSEAFMIIGGFALLASCQVALSNDRIFNHLDEVNLNQASCESASFHGDASVLSILS